MSTRIINKDTAISVSVLVLIGGAIWWAATIQGQTSEIPPLRDEVRALNGRVAELTTEVAIMNEKLNGDSKAQAYLPVADDL